MDSKTICEICVLHSLPLRLNERSDGKVYCQLETGLGILEGKYRKPTPDENEEYNYECTYKTPREMHSRIFGGGTR